MGPVGTFPWEGARMQTKRHAVVVTHSRLRQEGTVVAEAVDQLHAAGFEVAIVDNIEAPAFASHPPVVN
ncbi:NAD(+) kinase [Bifidobacterium longum]|uniref:NAD(+) kinase n=1 Tax=Bifidobacterium longum TaxID=216816 RepID=A0A2N0TLV4_BIFLN|nr:NAD(+) kinase [Bifidobacterium longum]